MLDCCLFLLFVARLFLSPDCYIDCLVAVPHGRLRTIPDPTIPLKVNTDIAKINSSEVLYHTLEADNAHRVSNYQENFTNTIHWRKMSHHQNWHVRKRHDTLGAESAKCPTIKKSMFEKYTQYDTP